MLPFNPTWKIGTYVAGGALLVALTIVFLLKWQLNSTREELDRANALLVTARNNVTLLEGTIDTQNKSIDAMAKESKRRSEAAAKELAEAQKRTRVVEKRVAVLQDRPIQGSTLEARVLDVDGMVLETIK